MKKTLLKVAVSLLLIGILINSVDVPDLLARIRNINPWSLFAAMVVMFFLSFAHAARWSAIIRANNARMPFFTSLKLVLVGYFFSQLLPSSIGGDAMRIWQARRVGLSLGAALNTVVLDRLVALAALLLMTAAALPWLLDLSVNPAIRLIFMLVPVAGAAAFGALLAVRLLPNYVSKWRIARAAVSLSEAASKTLLNVGTSFVTLTLSVGVHVGVALVVYILADALGVKVSPLHCIFLVPLVMLVSMIPISIASWGVREGAMVIAFGLIQVPRSDAIAVSLLFGAALLVTSLPGGVLWWRSDRRVINSDVVA